MYTGMCVLRFKIKQETLVAPSFCLHAYICIVNGLTHVKLKPIIIDTN
jgi:hypothetical protein